MRQAGRTISMCFPIKDSLLKGDSVFLACWAYPYGVERVLSNWGLECSFTEVYNTNTFKGHTINGKCPREKIIGYKIEFMGVPVWLIDKWKEDNRDPNLPLENINGQRIVIGCNYHTTWQSNNQMRFVLSEVVGERARLQTRISGKDFWTDLKDLIFIRSGYNIDKGKELRPNLKKKEL